MEGLDMADDQSSDGKRMGVPASNEPADGKQDSPKVYDMSLAQRLAAIRAEASGIGKEPIQMQNKERTKSWTIQAHTIEGILHGMRGCVWGEREGRKRLSSSSSSLTQCARPSSTRWTPETKNIPMVFIPWVFISLSLSCLGPKNYCLCSPTLRFQHFFILIRWWSKGQATALMSA